MEQMYVQSGKVVVCYKPAIEPVAMNELHALAPDCRLERRMDDTAAYALPQGFLTLRAVCRVTPPVFLRHMHPVQAECTVADPGTAQGVLAAQAAALAAQWRPQGTGQVQCRIKSDTAYPFGNTELAQAIAQALGLHSSAAQAQWVLSVTVIAQTAYFGISAPGDNLSPWSGGVRFFARESTVSRAEFKLEEAIEHFGIHLKPGMRALDLGAAPGGWSHYLALQGVTVDAVDPAELDVRVLAMPQVAHHRMLAQQFLRQAPALPYDLIVNDMKMDALRSIEILCSVAEHLADGGACIMTLKLPHAHIQRAVQGATARLRRNFTHVRAKQLYYNRSEVTVLARK